MKTFDFALDAKAVGDAGEIEGYASTFGNVDQGGDVVERSAFAEGLEKAAAEGRSIPMLWQHDQREPIGLWSEIKEDRRGLKVRGQLLIDDDAVARRAYAHLKAGSLRGLSIGYVIPSGGAEPDEKRRGITRLKKIDLREISLVTMPMNLAAQVSSVKSEDACWDRLRDLMRALRDGEPRPIKEFEDLLREAGAPKAMAVQIASVGYAKAIRSESEGKANEQAGEALLALREAVAGFRT